MAWSTRCLIVVGALSVLLPGCAGTPPAAPLPTLESLAEVEEMAPRRVPTDQDLTTTITLPRKEINEARLADGVSAPKGFASKQGARVVISVPVEEQEREARQRDGVNDTAEIGDGGITSFQTTGYFNKAEQQIERSLITKSFDVQDRSKFEAKLRDRRTKTESGATSEAKQAELTALEAKKDSGEITIDEWAKELAAIEKKYKALIEKPSASRGRKQKELFDISELIRAAQEGEVQADYILQVNTFRTEQLSDRAIHLLEQPEFKTLCRKHPGLKDTLQQTGNSMISQPGFFGLLNAKLIDVQTGVIRWIGEHRVESQRVFEDGYRVIVPITKRVSNAEEIAEAIRKHNGNLRREREKCEALRKRVNTAFDQAVAAQGTEHHPKLDQAARKLAADYNRKSRSLRELMGQPAPQAARAGWEYEYLIGDVSTRPAMPTTEVRRDLEAAFQRAKGDERRRLQQTALRYTEFLNQHFSELAKLVAKELISTIPSE